MGSLAPLAMASISDPVPACCRKDGKHHCNMGTSRLDASRDGQPRLRTQAPDCPFRSQQGVPTIAVVLPSDANFATQLFASARLLFSRSVPAQRGRNAAQKAWLLANSATADQTTSVCTGAAVLAVYGVSETRFVENGKIATAGGAMRWEPESTR